MVQQKVRMPIAAAAVTLTAMTASCAAGSPPSAVRSVGNLAATAAAPSSPPRLASPSPSATEPSLAASPNSAAAETLAASEEAWRLPAPLSREVVLTRDGRLLVVGGLEAHGSTDHVSLIDPATGAATPNPPLANAVHDAAGASLAHGLFLFAGGNTATVAAVQQLQPHHQTAVVGQLPTPRSDLSAVNYREHAYLIGGYDGSAIQPSVLMTADGAHFQAVAQLPVPVRYAAVAVTGDLLWIFGGEHNHALTRVIQQVNLATGHARVVGRLSAAMDGAAAFVLGGHVYLAGGRTSSGSSDQVWLFDPAAAAMRPMGRLPYPVANAGATTIAGVGYLLGGETPSRTNRVIALRLVATPG